MNQITAILILALCATITGICGWLAVCFVSSINKKIKHPVACALRNEVYHAKNETALTYRESGFLWACLSFALCSFAAIANLIEEIIGGTNHSQQKSY